MEDGNFPSVWKIKSLRITDKHRFVYEFIADTEKVKKS